MVFLNHLHLSSGIFGPRPGLTHEQLSLIGHSCVCPPTTLILILDSSKVVPYSSSCFLNLVLIFDLREDIGNNANYYAIYLLSQDNHTCRKMPALSIYSPSSLTAPNSIIIRILAVVCQGAKANSCRNCHVRWKTINLTLWSMILVRQLANYKKYLGLNWSCWGMPIRCALI